jgi:hypothetical protein
VRIFAKQLVGVRNLEFRFAFIRVGLAGPWRLPVYPRERTFGHVSKVQADIVASIDTSSAESRQLAPFDPVYVNRLQEAFQLAGTNVCDLQAIPDAILNGT